MKIECALEKTLKIFYSCKYGWEILVAPHDEQALARKNMATFHAGSARKIPSRLNHKGWMSSTAGTLAEGACTITADHL